MSVTVFVVVVEFLSFRNVTYWFCIEFQSISSFFYRFFWIHSLLENHFKCPTHWHLLSFTKSLVLNSKFGKIEEKTFNGFPCLPFWPFFFLKKVSFSLLVHMTHDIAFQVSWSSKRTEMCFIIVIAVLPLARWNQWLFLRRFAVWLNPENRLISVKFSSLVRTFLVWSIANSQYWHFD